MSKVYALVTLVGALATNQAFAQGAAKRPPPKTKTAAKATSAPAVKAVENVPAPEVVDSATTDAMAPVS